MHYNLIIVCTLRKISLKASTLVDATSFSQATSGNVSGSIYLSQVECEVNETTLSLKDGINALTLKKAGVNELYVPWGNSYYTIPHYTISSYYVRRKWHGVVPWGS